MRHDILQHQKEFYERYWQQRKKLGHLHWLPERVKIAAEMIVKDFSDNKKRKVHILDVGCGEGALGKLLKERLKEKTSIVGCDISKTALKEAADYYSDLFQIDIETNEFRQRFKQQKFDYIVILEVLEHLFEPEKVLRQCSRLLKNDGFLITSFPNIAWYQYRMGLLKGRFPRNYLLHPREHFQNFTFYSFAQLLRENGFSPFKTDGQFIFPKIFKPRRFFLPIFKKFPNLFGYQIVIVSKKKK